MKKNVFLIILSVLLVLAIGVSVYFVLKYRKTNTSLQTENTKNSDLTKERDDLKTQLDTVKSNQNTTTNTNTNNSTDVKTVEVNKFVPFDVTKIKNLPSDTKINEISRSNDPSGTAVSLDNNGNVFVEVYNTEGEVYKNLKAELRKEYKVTGFSGRVVDVYICIVGQAVDYPIILFLLEDGSVEYLDSQQAFEDLNFSVSGKISYLSNVVRFEKVGNAGIVAMESDGSSYIIDTASLNK